MTPQDRLLFSIARLRRLHLHALAGGTVSAAALASVIEHLEQCAVEAKP
jgi:hypothetical protein